MRETEDQLTAIHDVKKVWKQPMDRLICGDVGYGKTEVAIRAAFKVLTSGKQVAMLVPTTILAMQHYSTFKERFAPFPIKVEQLSRFKGKTNQKKVLEGLKDGTIEMVIGTHRLLSKDVEVKNLGLLIIDEEQRFGVEAKERIKSLKENVDVLTLTATPIPRTLEMTLHGVREVSQINSSPEGRKPVKTYVLPYSEKTIKEAIETEIARGGQIYYVNNRIKGLASIQWKLEKIVPKARIAVAHGQMSEDALEEIMIAFYQGEIDVLLCTTIIESGLDIPSAGTLIVENAQNLGLAQMYQLRGRVGRSERRAYAYFLYPNEKTLTDTARQRLNAIRDFVELGAGLKVAMRDLEIRGAGNILGSEQSGHISAIGYDLYLRMLEDAKKRIKNEQEGKKEKPVRQRDFECSIDLRISGYIPERYIPDEALRIDCYQRMIEAKNTAELKKIEDELEDRFGHAPPEIESLFELVRLRVLGANMGITQIVEDNLTINFHFGPVTRLREDFLDRLLSRFGERTTVRPNMIRIRKLRENPVEISREFIKLACEEDN
ncbi:MAG: TRCF domain-containing protein [Caldisericia bacterium]